MHLEDVGDKPFIFVDFSQRIRDTAVREILQWANVCSFSHPECKAIPRLAGLSQPLFRPTRLLSISLQENEPRHVKVISGQLVPPGERYITLSHCWGKSQHLRLLKSNYDQFCDTIPLEDIAKTFLDAIIFIGKLGLSYLWIDALCIIQDSEGDEDWIAEAPKMCSVYANSDLNISAAAAADEDGGLFFADGLDAACPYTVDAEWSGPRAGKYLMHVPLAVQYVLDSPLSKRAWVIQEQMLAPRTVHFAKDQVWWDCAAVRACETFPQGRDSTKLTKLFDLDQTFWDPRRPLTATDLLLMEIGGQQYRSLAQLASNNHGEISASQWQQILSRYTKSGLSRLTDKLVAIAGIAQAVQLLKNVPEADYLAGLWKTDFPDCLLWQSSTGNSVCPQYIAPSWSWASTTGSISYLINCSAEEITFRPPSVLVERPGAVLDAWVDNGPQGKFGSVTSGQLSIAAPIYNIELKISQEGGVSCKSIRIGHRVFHKDTRPSRIFQPFLDHTSSYEKALAIGSTICAYFCKINVFEDPDPHEFRIAGLLLERVTVKRGTYRRIGTLHWSLCLTRDEFMASQKDLIVAQLINADDYINDLGEGRFEIIII
ncbi:MAG: hypothetical protein Q9187_007007 [Circinaria calcarea]